MSNLNFSILSQVALEYENSTGDFLSPADIKLILDLTESATSDNLLFERLTGAATFAEFQTLVEGMYPDINESYYLDVKTILDLTVLNLGTTMPNEFLSLMTTMKDLEATIQEGTSVDRWEIAKVVLQYLSVQTVQNDFDRSVKRLAAYLLDLIAKAEIP